MKLRGRWMEYRVGDRMVPLMPTLHPAYLLRQPAHKKLAWRDLQSVRDRMPGACRNPRRELTSATASKGLKRFARALP